MEAITVIGPSVILAFLSGMLSALTPCILPILPPMLAGSMGHRLRPIFIVMGAATTFTIMGGVFSVVGSVYARDYMRYFFIGMIILFGAIWADREINELFSGFFSRLLGRLNSMSKGRIPDISSTEHPLLSGYTLGMSLGVVWIPCIGPILGSILAYTTYQGSLLHGSLLLLVYSAGLSVPILLVAYGGKRYSSKLDWANRNSEALERFAGFVMIFTGLAILWGFDKWLQALLLPYISELEIKMLEYLGIQT